MILFSTGFICFAIGYLRNGIHRQVRLSMSAIGMPRNLKERLSCKQQEGARKNIDHLCGFLYQNCQILYRRFRMLYVSDWTEFSRHVQFFVIGLVKSAGVLLQEAGKLGLPMMMSTLWIRRFLLSHNQETWYRLLSFGATTWKAWRNKHRNSSSRLLLPTTDWLVLRRVMATSSSSSCKAGVLGTLVRNKLFERKSLPMHQF